MDNKHLKVTIEGAQGAGKTTLAALLTWALRKFNYTLDYKTAADRTKWMQLSGDETELSHRVADMFKKGNFPSVEVHETNIDSDAAQALLLADHEAEVAALKHEIKGLKIELEEERKKHAADV